MRQSKALEKFFLQSVSLPISLLGQISQLTLIKNILILQMQNIIYNFRSLLKRFKNYQSNSKGFRRDIKNSFDKEYIVFRTKVKTTIQKEKKNPVFFLFHGSCIVGSLCFIQTCYKYGFFDWMHPMNLIYKFTTSKEDSQYLLEAASHKSLPNVSNAMQVSKKFYIKVCLL